MYTFVILALTLPLVLVFLCISRRIPPNVLLLKTHDEICALLDPPGTSTSALLRRRAIPNAGLLQAFGIHNSTFTSPSDDVHRIFKKHVLARLRAIDQPHRWQRLKAVTHGAVDFYLPDQSTPGNYAACMQAIVFVTVLAALFDCTPPFPDVNDIRFVTEGINELWMSSKSSTSHSSTTPPTLLRINQYFQAWLLSDPTNPFIDNPLEVLLPAYETMWRLVAHAYIYVEGSHKHTPPLLDFFDNPTPAQFRFSGDSETPSAHNIVQEVLRLHPPTKRIKRTSDVVASSWARRCLGAVAFRPTISACNIIVADIEGLQRSSVWDPSPHDFDAMRHRTSTAVQKQCFMAFGHGPLSCVASTWAPRFAGMIVAGLAKRDDIELVRGESTGGREGWEGWEIGRRAEIMVATAQARE